MRKIQTALWLVIFTIGFFFNYSHSSEPLPLTKSSREHVQLLPLHTWESCNPENSEIISDSFRVCPPTTLHSSPTIFSISSLPSLVFEKDLLSAENLNYKILFYPDSFTAESAVKREIERNPVFQDASRFQVVSSFPTQPVEGWKVAGDLDYVRGILVNNATKLGTGVPGRQLFLQIRRESQDEKYEQKRLGHFLVEQGFDGTFTGSTPRGEIAMSMVRRRNHAISCGEFYDTELRVFQADKAFQLLKDNLKPNFTMLEWGSGGSTGALSQMVGTLYSIEHDSKWYKKVRCTLPQILEAENSEYAEGKEWVNLGYVKNDLPWRWPPKGWTFKEDGSREQFGNYIRQCKKFGVKRFDAVLIDGRARVECAKEVRELLDENSLVFVHDWSRKEYHLMETFGYRTIKVSQEMAMLKLDKSYVTLR